MEPPEVIDYQAELLVTLGISTIAIALGAALLFGRDFVQQWFDRAWKHRVKLGIAGLALMALPASAFNASITAEVPHFIQVLAWVLGTIVAIPVGAVMACWLGKLLIVCPVRWLSNENWLALKLGIGLLLVVCGIPFFAYTFWESWWDRLPPTNWMYSAVIPSFAASLFLVLPSMAGANTEQPADAKPNPRPCVSPIVVLPLCLFATFAYAAVFRYDLRTIILQRDTRSLKQNIQFARFMKQARWESGGAVYPADREMLLIRTQASDSTDCLSVCERLDFPAPTNVFEATIVELHPQVRLAPLSKTFSLTIAAGELSLEQLKELSAVEQIRLRDVKLPTANLGGVDLQDVYLQATPNIGIAGTLDEYATESSVAMFDIQCEIETQEDWEAVLRASERRKIRINPTGLPREVLNAHILEAKPRMLFLSNFDKRNPAPVRFALRNKLRIGYARRAQTVWEEAWSYSAAGMAQIDDRWVYERDAKGNPIGFWAASEAIWHVKEYPTVKVLHLENAFPYFGHSSCHSFGAETQGSEKTIWAEHVPNLRELYFDPIQTLGRSDCRQLEQLVKLETLQLGTAPEQQLPVDWVSQLKQLNHIRIFTLPHAGFCEALAKLPNLQRVEIYDPELESLLPAEVDACKQAFAGMNLTLQNSSEYKQDVPESFLKHMRKVEQQWLENLDAMIENGND